MRRHQTNLPLLIGFLLATAAHLGAAAAYVSVRDQPDVQVESIETDRLSYQPTDTLTARVRLSNHGGAVSKRAALRLYLGTPDAPKQWRLGDLLIDPLQQSAVRTISSAAWPIDSNMLPGAYRVMVETNAKPPHRVFSKPFHLRTARPEDEAVPDLVAQRLIRPQKLAVGEPLWFTAVVTNRGAEAGPASVRIEIDGTTVVDETLEAMRPGQIRLIRWSHTFKTGGIHTVRLGVDLEQQIEDLDRSNNTLVRRWLSEDDNQPALGQLTDPRKLSINFLSYKAFEKLRSKNNQPYDQAAVQKTTQPTTGPLRPVGTDPGKTQRPGAPATSTALAATKTGQTTPRPEPTTADKRSSSPKLNAPRTNPAHADLKGRVIDPGKLLNPDRQTPNLLSGKRDPRQKTVDDAPPNAAQADRLIAKTKQLNSKTGQPRLPTPLNDRATTLATLQSATLKSDPKSNPAKAAKRNEQATGPPALARLPVPPDPTKDPAAPKTSRPDPKATDRKTVSLPSKTDGKTGDSKTSKNQKTNPASKTTEGGRRAPTASPKDRREATPVTILVAKAIKPGAVIAQQGLRVNTAHIHFSFTTRITTSPTNPRVQVIFNAKGRVLNARILKSSGYTAVDATLLNSLYKWTAEGKALTRAATTKIELGIDFR